MSSVGSSPDNFSQLCKNKVSGGMKYTQNLGYQNVTYKFPRTSGSAYCEQVYVRGVKKYNAVGILEGNGGFVSGVPESIGEKKARSQKGGSVVLSI